MQDEGTGRADADEGEQVRVVPAVSQGGDVPESFLRLTYQRIPSIQEIPPENA